MVVTRIEMDETMFNVLSNSTVGCEVNQVLEALTPGTTMSQLRKEDDIFVAEVVIPDEMVIGTPTHMVVATLKVEEVSKYDYDLERRFELI